ncbi:PKD domain-containing protein [Inquilinus sp. KBS0705]|nr:PKD domain-containing protein [Inquilinus sp. KBS0705]
MRKIELMDKSFTKTLFVFLLCLGFLTGAKAQTCTADFTASTVKGCGPLRVVFTNKSVPSAGNPTTWDFADGSTTTEADPIHIFAPSTDGSDKIYRVKLTVTGSCGTREAFKNITVLSRPAPAIVPGAVSICAPYILTVKNSTLGTNNSYTYRLYDGNTVVNTIVKTDKSDVQIPFDNLPVGKTYVLNMEAQNECGSAVSTSYQIPVAPRIFQVDFTANKTEGCEPLTIQLNNVSVGAANYYYFIYDANNNLIARQNTTQGITEYKFPGYGNFYIQLTGYGCETKLSERKPFRVYPVPKPEFTINSVRGCRELLVTFSNKTQSLPDAQSSSLIYTWDFGDGTQYTVTGTNAPPQHLYRYAGSPFTVSLTATDPSSGCADIAVKQRIIVVTPPPGANFNVKPDTVTSLPNYTFSFEDRTVGTPIVWDWTFGDGKASIDRNPVHTYADTGRYKVRLKVIDRLGCDSTITKTVHITGIPGQLYVPNAFMPGGSSTQLRTFMAKGSGIGSYRLQVFNKWGALLWETTKLDSNGSPAESWDGTFKGQPVPQGAYVWQATAVFLNGSEWKGMSYNANLPKRAGVINLLR